MGEILCVWLSQKSSQIPASTTLLCDGHYLTSAFEIFPYFDQKTLNWIQGLVFMEGTLEKVILHFEAPPGHPFFGANQSNMFTLLQIFPPGDENSFSKYLPFCPLGDTNVDSQLGASSISLLPIPAVLYS